MKVMPSSAQCPIQTSALRPLGLFEGTGRTASLAQSTQGAGPEHLLLGDPGKSASPNPAASALMATLLRTERREFPGG